MKVMVTGGAGFIGSHIADMLCEEDIETVVVDNFSTGRRDHPRSGLKHYQADIVSMKLKEIFAVEKPDAVIHHAAQINVGKSMADPFADSMHNLLGTINVLTCCRDYGVKKMVYASTCAVYGETPNESITETHPVKPSSFYALSKYNGEQYVRLFQKMYGLPYTILRYANVYGPRQSSQGEGAVIPVFVRKLFSKEPPVIYGTGFQTRDFVFVEDVAKANLLALQKGNNTTLNIGTNKQTSIHEVYNLIANALSSSVIPTFQPMRKGDLLFSCLHYGKAKAVLNWQPAVCLEEGLGRTIEYYQKHL